MSDTTGAGDAAHASWILELRARLATPAPSRLRPQPGREPRPAAVLVPLYVEAGQLWTLLSRRSDGLPHHRGQIAFPGGGAESGEDAWSAALRETREELGCETKGVLRLGQLDEAETPSGFRIIPCVGAIAWPLAMSPSKDEIDEVFSVPLSEFANPRLLEERQVRIEGKLRPLRVYHVGGRAIWGLTARIVQNLLERMGLAAGPAASD